MMYIEPVCLDDFLAVDANLSVRMECSEADHETVREWPGLASEVADILDFDPDLFTYLTVHGLFQAFSRLHKTGKDTVKWFGEPGGPGKKEFVSTFDENNYGWRDAREFETLALGTFLRPHLLPEPQLSSAPAAIARSPIPLHQMDSHFR